MRRPIIGISGSIDKDETRQFILIDYMRAVLFAGGIPVIMSIDMDEAEIKECLCRLDGVLLAGGSDLAPELYGEEPCEALGEVNPLRDRFEISLLKLAYERDMPVFGICRGIQSMAVAFGGTLYQDIPLEHRAPVGCDQIVHAQACASNTASHSVSVAPDSLLRKCLPSDEFMVNSFHHQAVKKAPKGFTICAHTPDGIIEGIEAEGKTFFIGVQWHPERMYASDEASAMLFKAHIDACIRHSEGQNA